MRPEDLGFVVPCERCRGPVWEALAAQCGSYYDGRIDEWALAGLGSVLAAHDLLRRVAGSDAVACGACGARWRVVDVEPQFRTADVRQESPDGRHFCTGRYEGGERHGPFGYYAHRPEGGWDLFFAEWWDRGRLVAWQEYGPAEVDAQGNRRCPVVRSWPAVGESR